jgi:hypothetical protein
MNATQITEQEFRGVTAQVPNPLVHDEREWWRGNDRYGVVIRDKVDQDWSWVTLAQNPHTKAWQAFDLGTSLANQDEARDKMLHAMEKPLNNGWYR